MDENPLEKTSRNLGGKAQEGASATGDLETTTEGVMNQAAGTTQDTVRPPI